MKITLKTLPQATAQQVFDQVAQHLLIQKIPSEDNDQCRYRAYNGRLSCAAGCLISDEEYSEELEGMMWSYLVEQRIAPEDHKPLICSLQRVHDLNDPEDWPDKLREVAHDHDLSAEVLS